MARADLRARKRAATEDRLAGATLPSTDGWLGAAREDALARLRGMGLPTRRDEYWRFTDPATLTAAEPVPAAARDDEPGLFDGVDALRIVFRDGVFDADASDDLEANGLEIARLDAAGSADIHWARGLYGALEGASHGSVERPLSAFNTAFASDGLLIRATGEVARPVLIEYVHVAETSDAVLHHAIRVEAGASLTLLEQGAGAARLSKGMEVDVADDASLDHVRIQGPDAERRAAAHIHARLGARARLKSFTLTVNGALTRNEATVELTGDHASAHLAGACVGDGAAFHHDDTVFVTHAAEDCESRQVFKKVLRNGAVGAFQGKILVRPGAQRTDGYQISQSLMLDGDSTFLVKPELEIYADDVACSHGSTSGAIDEDALFYLRARGVPRAVAVNLLTLSFLAEALEEIADEALAELLSERLAIWLERHAPA
ncbi:MAG: SufB/SufD family protein [Paracoccaceae bacterium]